MSPPTSELVLRIVAGPDADRTLAPGPDSLVIGRAPGDGRIDDPVLEPHHLLIRPAVRWAVQLAGRIAARVDGTPVGSGVLIRDGSVIEVGSSRVVARLGTHPETGDARRHRVVLGVGPRSGDHPPIDDDGWFAALAVAERARSIAPVTLDVRATHRLLITGPSAAGLVRSLAGQLPPGGVVVRREADGLLPSPRRGALTVAVDPDPEAGWPSGELPADAAVVSVGASWAATLTTPIGHGATAVRRFHAAGRAAQGWTGRSSLNR